eukprot:2830280-Prorocentrum_lima.AAC.1
MTVRIGRGSAVPVLAGIGLDISGASDATNITTPRAIPGSGFLPIVNKFCKAELNTLRRRLSD